MAGSGKGRGCPRKSFCLERRSGPPHPLSHQFPNRETDPPFPDPETPPFEPCRHPPCPCPFSRNGTLRSFCSGLSLFGFCFVGGLMKVVIIGTLVNSSQWTLLREG